MEWWNGLTLLQQVFAIFAVPATVVLIIQTVLSLFGMDNGADAHGDGDVNFHDGHGDHPMDPHDVNGHENFVHDGNATDALRMLTLKGVVSFCAIGGWMGFAALSWNLSAPLAIALALVAGYLAMYFIAWTVRTLLRLQSSGNVLTENALGKRGEVYIRIPAERKGRGKITVLVQERLCEMEAETENQADIDTGKPIIVTGLTEGKILLVMPEENSLQA